ncbi:DUF748 domain-containing protein [Geoalkalibacter subterraneus]|uniref:AsmA domain-containing protein n=1 Tax=Geoalkalibacter subterraneus TaxID=483547 RepID=A0A0B5FCK2_9BACT|nr:DUF748 domain-containing protein [Geoalkalibacter subterraneus]AJF05912.1 hypothetical protein GSUB_04125 [Geoalkalibacter subterraneus]
MTEPKPQEESSPPLKRRRRLWWILAGLVIATIILLAATPFAIRWGIEKALSDQGAPNAQVKDVDFNPFTGVLVIKAFRGNVQSEQQRLAAVQIQAQIDWFPLWQKNIYIPEIALRDVDLHLQRDDNGSWTIGELNLPSESESGKKPEEDEDKADGKEPWGFGIGQVALENVRIHYRDPKIVVNARVANARLGSFETWSPEQATPFDLDLTVNQGRIRLEGETRPLSSHPEASARLRIDQLPIGWLQPLLEEHSVSQLSGNFDTDLQIAMKTDQETSLPGFSVEGSIGLDSASLDHSQAGIGHLELTWDGKTKVRLLPEEAPPEWSVDGDLHLLSESLQWTDDVTERSAGGDMELTQRICAQQKNQEALEASLDGSLHLAGLNYRDLQVSLKRGSLTWEGNVALEHSTRKPQPAIEAQGTLAVPDLALDLIEAGYGIAQQKFTADIKVEVPAEGAPAEQLGLAATLSLEGLDISNLRQESKLLQLERFTVTDLDMAGMNSIGAASIRLDNLRAVERKNRETLSTHAPDAVLSSGRIELTQASLKELKALRTKELQIEDLNAWVLRDKDGRIEAVQALAPSAREDGPDTGVQEKPSADAETDSESHFEFSLQRFLLAGDNRIDFIDRSVTPEVHQTLSDLSLEATGIDNSKPGQDTRITAKSHVGEHGILNLDGSLNPFGDQFSSDLLLKLRNINLSAVDGYLRKAIGYRFKSGRLDGEINGQVENDLLDSNLDLVFAQLEVEAVREEDQTEASGELGVPLGTALNLVRDSDGTIHLDIPIQGDFNDPAFRIGKVVRTAVFQTLKKGMVSYYAPLGASLLTGAALPAGAIWAVGKLYDMATTLRFDPMLFGPGEYNPTEQQQQKLKEMAQLLQDRPDARLVVCGIAAPPDLEVLRAERAESQDNKKDEGAASTGESKPEPSPPASEEEKQAMYELARQRAGTVQTSLIEAGIAEDRILTCSPDYQSQQQAQPRVELGI